MRFIGITGGVGAGKTEILNYIAKHYKCEIYLADRVAEELQEPDSPCFAPLVALLGEEILGTDGRIDRKRMSARIFMDTGLLEKVNAIVHPAVKVFLLDRLEKARALGETELFFVEAALLIEGGYGALVDEMWYVHANEAVRVRRLREGRGYSAEKTARIMASQLQEKIFRENCDFVIDNSGSLEESFRQVDERLKEFAGTEGSSGRKQTLEANSWRE